MLDIHHALYTRGYRIIWLCEELGIPYRVHPVDMSPAYRASPPWRRLNPVGKVPVMTDGDITMFESGAMLQYVLERYGEGRLQPQPGTSAHAFYLQWCWFAEATFSRPIGEIVNHRRVFGSAEQPEIIAEMKSRATLCADAVEQALQGKAYLLGESFTAADIMMGYTLRIYLRLVSNQLSPNLTRYWDTLTQRPAYRAAEAADNKTASP